MKKYRCFLISAALTGIKHVSKHPRPDANEGHASNDEHPTSEVPLTVMPPKPLDELRFFGGEPRKRPSLSFQYANRAFMAKNLALIGCWCEHGV
jgi:hypothetical protein